MQKKVIYRWTKTFQKNKDVSNFLEKSCDFSEKYKVGQIIIPHIISINSLISDYKGRRISFAISDYKDLPSLELLKDLRVKYVVLDREVKKNDIDKILKNKLNIIFLLNEYTVDNEGNFFDKLDEELSILFANLKPKNENEIYIVFSHSGEVSHEDLERVFIYIRYRIEDYFNSGKNKIKIFYQINNIENFSIYKKFNNLDGVYINDNRYEK